jgi:hypothetical protein
MAETAFPTVVETHHRNGRVARGSPAFAELVYAHSRWRRATARGSAPEVEEEYRRTLERFERTHGRILDAYWCSNVESAVALTERPRPRVVGLLLQPRLDFHRVTDWATKSQPDVAGELHACDELAVRAGHVLSGLRRRICMQLVMAVAMHLLSLVDARAAHDDEQKTHAALTQERSELVDVRRYYRQAANGQAQMIYFLGMAVAALAVGGLACGLWLTVGQRNLMGALIAGSIGAVVSVLQRINAGSFELDYDVGRLYVFFLGSLRPAIGGVFGMALSLAVTSGIVSMPGLTDGTDKWFAALLVVAFFSGFSERWAQDALATALPQGQGAPKGGPPPQSTNGTGGGAS